MAGVLRSMLVDGKYFKMVLPKLQPGQIELFRKRLPKRPYHTDSFKNGLTIADAARAIKSRYVQHNGPTHCYWLVFDLDRKNATMYWDDVDAPAPNITATNPFNGHAHLIYGLELPVRTAPDGSADALRYAAAIEAALRDLLGADIGYSGLICKNPLHEHWQVQIWEPHSYTLNWLEDYLDLSKYSDRRRKLPEYGLGRNCNLFNAVRLWSYRAIRQGWPDYDQWHNAVLERATAYNIRHFKPCPAGMLVENEILHTARSISKWTYRHFSPAGFSAWQARQGRKGGKVTASRYDMVERGAAGGVKGGALKGKIKRDTLLPLVLEMHKDGFTNADIAREVGESKMTVGRWVKRYAIQK